MLRIKTNLGILDVITHYIQMHQISIFSQITDPDVCQVRLDFETFRMSGPDLSSKTPPYGLCRGDRFAIFTTKQNLGLSEGNLLCGDMSGQHGKKCLPFYTFIV